MSILRSPITHVFGAAIAIAVGIFAVNAAPSAQKMDMHTSSTFAGPKANTGRVTHSQQGGRHLLTLSDDFKVPDTPEPHWQIVDSKGVVYQLDKLSLKGDRVQKTVTVPSYVPDIAKVIIWCAWAEANLGEAAFGAPLKVK
jgi:hypothetical protein